MTSFDFVLWNDYFSLYGTSGSDTTTSIQWSIGTTTGGSQDGSGTATVTGGTLSGSFDFINSQSFDVYTYTVSGLSVSLSAGTTYYLTLQNAIAEATFGGVTPIPDGDGVFWDQNDGPSAAYQNTGSGYFPLANPPSGNACVDGLPPCTVSETFDINGTTVSATPEPASLMLFGSGVLMLLGVLRRKAIR